MRIQANNLRSAARRWSGVASLLILVFFWTPQLSRVEFHGDESHWISTSRQFEAFVSGDWGSPVWDVQYWTLTQPPVPRYLIGLGRVLGGLGVSALNEPWDYSLNLAENTRIGALPGPALLWWSRLPMLLLAFVSAAMLMRLANQAAGWPAGVVVGLLFAGSRYLSAQLTRALGESALLAFCLLALCALVAALRGWRALPGSAGLAPARPAQALGYLALAGVAGGLAAASKLNGGLVLVACLAVWLLASLPRTAVKPHPMQLRLAAQGSLLLLGLGALAFALVNPFILHHPLHHTWYMYQQRTGEMKLQRLNWPDSRIDAADEWLRVVPKRILQDYAPVRFPGAAVVNLGLGALGVMALGRAARQFFAGSPRGRASRALLLASVTLCSLSLLTPLDWERYYLFPAVCLVLAMAAGVGEVGRLASRLAAQGRFARVAGQVDVS